MADQPTVIRVIYPDGPTIMRVGTVITTGGGGSMTAAEILAAIKTVDGPASGLDADLLDGLHWTSFASAIHSHAQSDISGLTAALALLAPLASPTFTGNPAAPTQTAGDSTTKIATTAFVTGAISTLSAAKQDVNTKLTTISGLTLSNDDFLQVKAGLIANRTIAQVKTDLGLTGTNSGDQTITLTGDVTGSGTGSFAATIANDAVSNAKLANMASGTIKARTSAGSGDPEDLAAGSNGQRLKISSGVPAWGDEFYTAKFAISGGGSAIVVGDVDGKVEIPSNCTLVGWSIAVSAGTATFKVWRKTSGTAVPTAADSINTSGVAISTGTIIQSTTLTDFTSTSFAADDILRATLTAVSGSPTWAELRLRFKKL